MDKCINDNCLSLHKAAQKHFRVVGSGVSPWQRSFTASDFEKHYLPRLDVERMIEMEKAQICVSKCKMPETIFNRATILNQEAAGTFIDKCISKVGLNEGFKGFSVNDPTITK